MSILAINNAILAKLQAMQTLKNVYNYESSDATGDYPFASLTLSSDKGVFTTTAHTMRTLLFDIKIRQEVMFQGQGPINAEQILIEVLDELNTAFDADTTLSGTCKFARPVSWVASYESNVHHERLITITLETVDVMQVRP